MTLTGALMVCGATSDAGKSTLVTGLCRVLARQGVSIAPFKGQNMALNSAVTSSGHEIGRAQALQARAAGTQATVAMNPVLIKPTGEQTAQVVVNGRPWKDLTASEYQAAKAELFPVVLDGLADLRATFDVVICEGAGSPAEINLLDHDIVNLPLAHAAGIPAIVVGDINLGGVFAALFGTVALLPGHLRSCVRGLVINKLRGDPALLYDGPRQLAERTGVPVLGVLPWLDEAGGLDAEDSMALDRPGVLAGEALADELDVAVIRLPRIANFTDFDPLAIEAGVRVRYVHDRAGLGQPDLIVLPGSKATVTDLAWLRSTGLANAVTASDAVVVGICAGYQMLGTSIDDSVEGCSGEVSALGLLPVRTRFQANKVTRQRSGHSGRHAVSGYQIHHGRVEPAGGDPWITLVDERPARASERVDGVRSGRRYGTTLHGLFEADAFRRAFLADVAAARGKRFESAGRSFETIREEAIGSLADVVAQHLDMAAIEALIASTTSPVGSRTWN